MKFSCTANQSSVSTIITGDEAFTWLNGLISSLGKEKIFILSDENSQKYCLQILMDQLPALKAPRILTIKSGEDHKSFSTVAHVWQELLEEDAGRDSLLVNLGGGVVTDLGGFVAATFKRGIRFINVPTTLMGMVDAAIGGKTGINIGRFKNQAGTFTLPEAVIVHDVFLQTLPEEQILSGFGEIIKYALIADGDLWKEIRMVQKNNLYSHQWMPFIERSIAIKTRLVNEDFKESGRRAILNFGHTIGHALESLSFLENKPLSHGHAVALGILCESYLSLKTGLDPDIRHEISQKILAFYSLFPVEEDDLPQLFDFLSGDKKRAQGSLNFSLIRGPGKPVFGIKCDETDINEAFLYYLHHDLQSNKKIR